MVVVVGVRFKRAGKIYYFDPDGLDINVGDAVIVETVRGVEYGDVVIGVKEVDESHIVAPLKKVLRVADPMDTATVIENKEKASQAMKICQEKIDFHNLPMKLIDVEYTFDNTKLIFYFTADGRVDFRELVKDLAAIFKTRIELRQIGVRDEAKMLGGLGSCGRALCCTTFLGDFAPVSIRMAKEQNLSLNPAKISGLCGRLMCCLRYECTAYKEVKETLPSVGDIVSCVEGTGKVIEINPLKKSAIIEIDDRRIELPAEEIESLEDETKDDEVLQDE